MMGEQKFQWNWIRASIGVMASLLWLVGSMMASGQLIQHERLLSFEEGEVPAWIKSSAGGLRMAGEHFKDGKQSLEWKYQPGAYLSIKRPVGFEEKDPTGKDLYLSTFVVWVHRERVGGGGLKFQYLKQGRVCCEFVMNQSFTGWRAAWVGFERDMTGKPELGMDEIRLVAPDEEGQVCVDHVVTASKMDQRYQAADRQVPFVNAKTQSHWLMIYHYSQMQPKAGAGAVGEKELAEVDTIDQRFRQVIQQKKGVGKGVLDELRTSFQHYRIERMDGQIRGLPIFFGRAIEAYERLVPNWKSAMDGKNMEVGAYFQLMNRIGNAYGEVADGAIKEELESMYLMMFDHMVDQGIADGSCLGNITHYGYSFRDLYPACYLMKEVLRKHGKLEVAQRLMQWYAMTAVIFEDLKETGIDMDAFNTQTTGRLASILMIEDLAKKVQYLQAYSKWIENGCLPAKGLMGAFKVDGGAFHHCNLYPAYAVGGLEGASKMIYLLSRTKYAVSAEAHQTVKNVLLAMRFYCNTRSFPLSLSGRHPDGKGKLVATQYAMMAESGTPDGKQAIDGEMASAFLRLVDLNRSVGKDDPEYMPKPTSENLEMVYADRFRAMKHEAEPEPHGNLAMGYGCIAVQRRQNWAAVARGHSRYLWAAEHYLTNNYYGRYLAHGSLQIMSGPSGACVTPRTSGWQEEGFDWNRIPGVTSMHLPYEQLKARVLNVDTYSGFEEMLYSDEAFAGGLSHRHKDGNFGMKLHEHDKYNGTLRARKSYHFVDGVIVALGSDIECQRADFPIETTVSQTWVSEDRLKEWKDAKVLGKSWMDPSGNGYYLPNGGRCEVHFPQISYGQNTGKETRGNWVTVVIDHGKAPKAGSYEYAVLPQCESKALAAMVKQPNYVVVRHDRLGHVVEFPERRINSYVWFEAVSGQVGVIAGVDQSCLLMTEMQENRGMRVTLAQPDLGLYAGKSDEELDGNGKRKERSVYSRPWIHAESRVIPVTVLLNGKWRVNAQDGVSVTYPASGGTQLVVDCKDGRSREMTMEPQG